MDLNEFRSAAATHLDHIADELDALYRDWITGNFESDALSETEYPFHLSVEDLTANVRAAVERIRAVEEEASMCSRCGNDLELCTPIMCARLDSDGEARTMEMQGFIDQNSESVKGFTQEMADLAEGYAQHYSGGLLVLIKRTPTGCLKMHDTWGDDGPVVVHHYGLDDEGLDAGSDTDPHEWVAHFQTGTEAFRLFRTIEEV